MKKGLNKSALQMIAVLAMLIDHAAIFVPVASLYCIMKFIGRMAIVIMCYFVAEVYHKTSDVGKYILRLGIFAAISQIPYYLYATWGMMPTNANALLISMFHTRNVIFTLFVGLCLLTILKSDYGLIIKVVAMFAAMRLAKYSDWNYFAVLWIVGFGLFYGSKQKQMVWLAGVLALRIILIAIAPIMTLFATKTITTGVLYGWLISFGGFLALIPLNSYNGERGKMPKWIWYGFYPVHLIVIVIIMAIVVNWGFWANLFSSVNATF